MLENDRGVMIASILRMENIKYFWMSLLLSKRVCWDLGGSWGGLPPLVYYLRVCAYDQLDRYRKEGYKGLYDVFNFWACSL